MTLSNAMALLSAMVVLAAIPSVSVVTVATRSASLGLIHGLMTTIGIVIGDVIFIIIAIWGLSFMATAMGDLFFLIKYFGGAYLIWLGIGLCRSSSVSFPRDERLDPSLVSSFLTGISITLADQKATLFYLGFFPAFLDLSKISAADTIVIIAIAIFAVGGVKMIYAAIADRARKLIGSSMSRTLNMVAGCVTIAVGGSLFFRG